MRSEDEVSWDNFKLLAQNAAWSDLTVDCIPLDQIENVKFEVKDLVESGPAVSSPKHSAPSELRGRLAGEAPVQLSHSPRKSMRGQPAETQQAVKIEKKSPTCTGVLSLFKDMVMGVIERWTGLDLNGDGTIGQSVVLPKIQERQEICLIIQTSRPYELNSGRSYVYKAERGREQEWVDLLLKFSSKARTKSIQLKLEQEHGRGVAYHRAKSKIFFESHLFQMWTAALVICGFFTDVAEAQLFPEEGSTLGRMFDLVNLAITFLFVAELALNLFSNSANHFREFWSQAKNWFDMFIVTIQVVSLYIDMQSGNVKLLRTIRIVRVFKIFSKFQNLHRIFQAMAYAAYPVSSALFILLVISAIYSIFGTHWFRDRSPEFADFRQSMYTLFIIFTGDGWSAIARSLMVGKTVDFKIAGFFVSYVFLAGIVLFNVVLAVLLGDTLSLCVCVCVQSGLIGAAVGDATCVCVCVCVQMSLSSL
jgi:voltage-gated sodium channel